MRERVPVRRLPSPQVAPAEPPLAELLRHDRLAVGPHVDEDQAHVGKPASRQFGDHVGVLAHCDVDIVEFVKGEVRCDVRDMLEGHDGVASQVDSGFVSLVVLPVEHDCERCPPHRIPRAPRLDLALRRFLQFDGREPECVPDEPFPTQDGGGLPELVRRQRLQRVLRHVREPLSPGRYGRSPTPYSAMRRYRGVETERRAEQHLGDCRMSHHRLSQILHSNRGWSWRRRRARLCAIGVGAMGDVQDDDGASVFIHPIANASVRSAADGILPGILILQRMATSLPDQRSPAAISQSLAA